VIVGLHASGSSGPSGYRAWMFASAISSSGYSLLQRSVQAFIFVLVVFCERHWNVSLWFTCIGALPSPTPSLTAHSSLDMSGTAVFVQQQFRESTRCAGGVFHGIG
jgi:hypothetical protein